MPRKINNSVRKANIAKVTKFGNSISNLGSKMVSKMRVASSGKKRR